MLSDVQLATVRAALQFWREEICPFGANVAAPYLDVPVAGQLSAGEVLALQRRFDETAVRYVLYDRGTDRITRPRLFIERRAAERLAGDGDAVGTAILGELAPPESPL